MAEALPNQDELEHLVRKKTETFEFADQFISLLHAGEQHSLGIWDKQVRLGSIKRRTEESVGPGQRSFHVIEIIGNNSLSTYIVAPKQPYVGLNVTLPNLVIVCKSIGRSFTFETQIEDDKGMKHRFRFSNSNLHIPRRTSYLTYIPMRLQDGWNDICVDLAHLADRVYGTKFVQFKRIQVFASVRIQQIFFVNDDIWRGIAPVPAIKMMDNVHMVPLTHLPIVNPLWREPGSEQRQIPHVPDPLETARVTRTEAELLRRGAEKIEIPIMAFPAKPIEQASNQKQKKVVPNKGSTKSIPSKSSTKSQGPYKGSPLTKIVIPEAEEAMKLLNVVKAMHLNPEEDPSVYVAALKRLREDESRESQKLNLIKTIFPPGKGNTTKSSKSVLSRPAASARALKETLQSRDSLAKPSPSQSQASSSQPKTEDTNTTVETEKDSVK